MAGAMSPEHSLTEQQQQQQLKQYWQQFEPPHLDHIQQQQQGVNGNHTHQGYGQAVIRRSSGDGTGYMTYNIFSLPRRRSNETGQPMTHSSSGHVTPNGSTHGGRSVLQHLEGGTSRPQHPAVQFHAVRESLLEGSSPAAAAANDGIIDGNGVAAAAAAAGGGGANDRCHNAAAFGAGRGIVDDLREPLLPPDEE